MEIIFSFIRFVLNYSVLLSPNCYVGARIAECASGVC